MRAKYINEKFKEDSDPIKDMGIGIYKKRNFKNYASAAKFMIEILPGILKIDKIPEDIIEDHSFWINRKYHDKIDNYMYTYMSIDEDPIVRTSRNNMSGQVHEHIQSKLKKLGY